MKTLRTFVSASFLSLVIASSALAGNIPTGVKGNIPTGVNASVSATAPGNIPTGVSVSDVVLVLLSIMY